jgi:hypothetical protein
MPLETPVNIRPRLLEGGLVLVPKNPEIECNEAGLEQGTLQFYCLNTKYPDLAPVRGTPCPDFSTIDTRTSAVLAELDYLGAQTRRFKRSGKATGLGILEILCQGARFGDESPDESPGDGVITEPFITSEFTPRTLQAVYLFHLDEENDWYTIISFCTLEYESVDVTWEYVASEKPTQPRFLVNGEYDPGPDDPAPIITNASGLVWGMFLESTQNFGAPLPFRVLDEDETGVEENLDYRPWIKLKMEANRLTVRPAGQYYHVIETNTVTITRNVPDPIGPLISSSG